MKDRTEGEHPLYSNNKVILETAATVLLSDALHQWAWCGATGGMVYGAARIGKTQALQQLRTQLVTRGGEKIPTVYFSVHSRDINTIAGIYRLLCNAVNLTHGKRDQADYLADAIVYFLIDYAFESKSSSLVLLVDEMQRLNVKQLNIFAELYDRLKLLNITLMTVFIGNDPECLELVEVTQREQYAHIRGRFFTQFYKFDGISSAHQVRKCLKQYDSMRYPEGGPSYAEFFLPEPVSNGFTLASLSDDIWQYYSEYAKPHNITSWGMQYFVATINCLLLDFLPKHGVESFDQDMVDAALDLSGLVSSRIWKKP